METATFYDDKGRPVQTLADNYKGGTDIATTLYSFTGKPVPITLFTTITNVETYPSFFAIGVKN